MKPTRLVGLALLVIGGVLLVFGYNSTQAIGEEFSEALTGRYSDATMFYLIGGGVAVVIGLVLLIKR